MRAYCSYFSYVKKINKIKIYRLFITRSTLTDQLFSDKTSHSAWLFRARQFGRLLEIDNLLDPSKAESFQNSSPSSMLHAMPYDYMKSYILHCLQEILSNDIYIHSHGAELIENTTTYWEWMSPLYRFEINVLVSHILAQMNGRHSGHNLDKWIVGDSNNHGIVFGYHQFGIDA